MIVSALLFVLARVSAVQIIVLLITGLVLAVAFRIIAILALCNDMVSHMYPIYGFNMSLVTHLTYMIPITRTHS
jgi:hypothetical protein